jgi:hypothetical protein
MRNRLLGLRFSQQWLRKVQSSAYANLLHSLLFDPENGGITFDPDVRLSPTYMLLQLRRPY